MSESAVAHPFADVIEPDAARIPLQRAWLGVAVLSASWLSGLGYYHHPDWLVWSLCVAAGVLLMLGVKMPLPTRMFCTVALLGLTPTLFLVAWPLKVIPVLLALGLALSLAQAPRSRLGKCASAALCAGAVLAAQALAIFAYQSLTGRSHDLPAPLTQALGWTAQAVGIDAAADSGDVALHTMRKLHRLGATWDLLLDPATLCFLVGGAALLALVRGAHSPSPLYPGKTTSAPGEAEKGATRHFTPHPDRLRSPQANPLSLVQGRGNQSLLISFVALTLTIVVWLFIRAGLMMALVVHRGLRVDYDSPVILMDQFRSTWVLSSLLIVPTLLACRFAGRLPAPVSDPGQLRPTFLPVWRTWAAAGATLLGIFVLCVAGLWDPPGSPKPGRVLVDEFHSKWEPTQRSFDTQWYGHDSGYNYAVIYDYLGHWFSMGRITTPIDDALLGQCDVLISKVPTERYAPAEVDAIERFVRRGGGLLLVGEHTDVFGTGVSLNDMAERFGFKFRYDVILDTDTSFQQAMERPLVSHPIIQRFGKFDFAVSCSIAPGASSGRAVVLSRSLRGLGPDYHASNFYPPIDDAADERFGAFVQCWATRQGAGRVVAWSDSTVWSNFCTFEPGKAELMLGLINWLNERNGAFEPRQFIWPLGLALLAAAVLLGRRWPGGWVVMLSAGLLGWAIAPPAIQALQLATHREAKLASPLHRVIIDQTVCNPPLSKGGFIEGKPDGFGVFERWIIRLGYYTRRAAGADALKDDLIVFPYPAATVPAEFRDALVRYVKAGGKMLVIDSPENTASTAGSLLYPFNMKLNHQTNETGDLAASGNWPTAHVAAACEVVGGEPLFTLNGKTVAATTRSGAGSVTVIGFGSRLADASMGVTGDTIPDDDLTKAYALDYALMRWLVEGIAPPAPAATMPSTTAPTDAPPPATAPPTTEPLRPAP